MNYKKVFHLITCLALIIVGCSKDESSTRKQDSAFIEGNNQSAVVTEGAGATQVDGVAFPVTNVECNSEGVGATYAIRMTGDLEGCLFIYIDAYECSPSGTYREIGREYFVGTYRGEAAHSGPPTSLKESLKVVPQTVPI